MKKLRFALAAPLVAVALSASVVFAAGPDAGTGPWENCNNPPTCGDTSAAAACTTQAGTAGHTLFNTNSGQFHCFAD